MATGLFAIYLVCGFFVLPAVVKWQVEKQVTEKLGQRINIGEVHFNPFVLRFEAGDFVLSDPESGPLVSFKRLLVDFELRSAIDRAWTFAHLTLEAPVLRFDLDKEGRHNFTTLLKRLRDNESKKQADVLPQFIFRRVKLNNARIEFRDRLLDEPLVARIDPLQIEIGNLSSLSAQAASYRLSGRTAAGETFESSGELALNPISSKGKLKLNNVKVATLARGLSRLVVLDPPAGKIDFAASFDFALDGKGAISGLARDIDLDVTALSLTAAGGSAPLMATETLSLKQGRIDLGKREAMFAGLRLAKGSISVAVDQAGSVDWANLLRIAAPATQETAAMSVSVVVPRGEQSAPQSRPWRIAVENAEVAEIAVRYTDAASGRSANIAAFGLGMSPTAEIGVAGTHLQIANPKITLAGVSASAKASSPADSETAAGSGLVQAASASFGAKLLTLNFSGGVPELSSEGIFAELSDAVVRSPADASELLRLGSATLSGGVLRLKDRMLSVEKLALANGKAQTRFDAQGKFNWRSVLRGVVAPDSGVTKSQQSAAPSALAVTLTPGATAIASGESAIDSSAAQAVSPEWRFVLKSAQLDGFALGFEDKRNVPGFAVGFEAMRARISGLDTGSATPLQVEIQAKIASGGEIKAGGVVRVDSGVSDLKLSMAGVALAPLQIYLSEFAELRLATGTLSGEGRLRYGDKAGAGAKLAYKGSIAVDRVLLEEVEPRRPFLSWDSVASGDVVLTLEPNRLDIGELRLERPSGRLIIAEDQTVNLTDLLKKPKHSDGVQNNAKSATAQPRESRDDIFPVTIARVRVSDGVFEFADLSLRPQFGTRMHELKGVITGLGSDANRSAQLQLDARVDKYGSAKIHGQISVRQPEKFTDIDMAFRNLELTSLSAYIAKFAGYRIASGRLALDLHYKVKDGKLLGENKIVLHQVELGEKVENPNALDLPLELAIAILKDSDGVIDIGLPVSGDLNDPQFDYGAIIGKAFANLLGSIITAPFRALGALFGGGSAKDLGVIDFEPGNDALAPPERQKLEAVARSLKQRPALMLVVPPTYAAGEDTPVMKLLAVHADIVKRMGVKLVPGENPGPIDTANSRVQNAVEAAFGQRYAPEVLALLKRRAVESGTDAHSPSQSAKQQSSPPPAFYQSLVERLIREQPVDEQMLAQLASRRSAAIIRELTTVGGVPASRIVLGKPRQANDANEKAVTLRLQLEVSK